MLINLWLILLASVHVSSGNLSADLYGVQDTRPSTWGYADSVAWPIVFYPPAGYQVRVYKISGDLVAWPKLITPALLPMGSHAGVLVGFSTTAPSGSANCNLCADNTPLYKQGDLSDRIDAIRVPFSEDYGPGFLLESDNQLIPKVASFLNTLGVPVHVEVTYSLTYRFEEIPK